jgi:hypothetical protein
VLNYTPGIIYLLFINNKGEQYTKKGLQKMLYELVPNKNTGINAFRSIYSSYWLPKLNKNQINRIAFLMRTSFNMLFTNYFKNNNEEEITNERQEKTQKDNKRQTEPEKNIFAKIRTVRDRKEYVNNYYQQNKEGQIKENERTRHVK